MAVGGAIDTVIPMAAPARAPPLCGKGSGRAGPAGPAALLDVVVREELARKLAKIADMNFAVRLGMYISGRLYKYGNFAPQISMKTWVAMSRNSGQHEVLFGPAPRIRRPGNSLKK